MLDAMLAKPNGDLVADLAYDLPALTILKLLGVPAEKVAEVKHSAKSRVLFIWGRSLRCRAGGARGKPGRLLELLPCCGGSSAR
jgi:cytochrome P450